MTLRILLIAIVGITSLTLSAQDQAVEWIDTFSLPGLERDDAVCFSIDETIYIGTGNHGGFAQSNRFYGYNTSTKSWTEVAEFPGKARQYARVEVVNNKAYLIAGIDLFNVPLNDVWCYDPKENLWTEKENFPGLPRWKTISFTIDKQIYFGCGRDFDQSFNDFWKYDPEKDTWNVRNKLPIRPRNEMIGFSLYSKGYVGLGEDCLEVIRDDIWKYDPFLDEWQEETIFPGGERWYAIASSYNGRAYVGTGEDTDANLFGDFWEYNPHKKTWKQLSNIPGPPRRGTAACAVFNKGIFIFGGLSEGIGRLKSIAHLGQIGIAPPRLNAFYQSSNDLIYLRNIDPDEAIQIYSLNGQKIAEYIPQSDHLEINTNDWSHGIYLIQSGEQATKVMKY